MAAIRTHLALGQLDPEALRGGGAIVIDLIRATTTIAHALAHGASGIVAVASIEAARDAAAKLVSGSFLLGGERQGVRIAGFDLGNSPREYTRERIGGRAIVFTTTNGTVALTRASAARLVWTGSIANLSATCAAAAESGLDVHLVCAGVNGKESAEDTICAGAMVEKLEEAGLRADAAGGAAKARWMVARASLIESLARTEGGLNLASAGLQEDLRECAAVDSCDIVAQWDGRLVTRAR